MTSTKRIKVAVSNERKTKLDNQIDHLREQLQQRLDQYKKMHGVDHIAYIAEREADENEKKESYDFINPQHYVQDDGRQTWEHMVDKFGVEKTAIFCELNAYKYRDRIGRKPGEDTSREQGKIDWYDKKANELYEQLELEKTKTKTWNLI